MSIARTIRRTWCAVATGLRRSRRTRLAVGACLVLAVSAATVTAAVADRDRGAKRVQAADRHKHRVDDDGTDPTTAPPTTAETTTTTTVTVTTTAPTTTTPPSTTAPPTTAARATTVPTTAAPPAATDRPPDATGRYVAPTGDDGAAGNADAPWRSLSVAVSRLNPGDTLYVRGGRYAMARDEQMNIEGKNGAANRWITITNYPGERPVIQLNSFWQGFLVKGSSFVEIRGLEIVGTANADQRATAGVEIRDSHHVNVIGNFAHDLGGCGICSINANHVRVEGNEVAATSKWNGYQTSAISFFTSMNIGGGNNGDGYSMYIRNNRVHHATNITPPSPGQKVTDGNCIIIDFNRDNAYAGATLVQNNLCYENGGRGVNVMHSDNVMVVNNTFVNNLRHPDINDAELTANVATNVVFRNNVVAPSRPGAGTAVYDAQATFDHNVYVGAAPVVRGASDKVVASALAPDFRPLAGSVLIDGSNPALAPTIDLTGAARIGVADIGAFELR